MNQINNKDFEEAYTNIDNKKIINKALRRYRKNIPIDDLKTCGLYGLWEALKNYNKTIKFTTFLYKVVNWECMRWITSDKNHRINKGKITSIYKQKSNEKIYDEFEDALSAIEPEYAIVLKQRIRYNMTWMEIGKENKYSHETARKKFHKAYDMIKDVNTTMSE